MGRGGVSETDGWIQATRNNAKDWRARENWMRFTAILAIVHWCLVVEWMRRRSYEYGNNDGAEGSWDPR